ncbi:hypothetical protein SAMN02745126_02091 [Enhydrobacter aerosaccus]|uniref:Uncharacterized protein n=1 Tax=Enhydrobacter aerosaccus TaxID=225324 RepID=A0A1T4N3X3_9HYPH|nr:hypothetical protein [Enhydrobacter aerosaccus]SJZ73767.1 hypothetical protein SAMN02745126_02091 [Enhydrobacter aerosaccus]
MSDSRYEREEYLEQDDEEAERARRNKSLVALLVLAVLVIIGIVVVERLRDVSKLQDCLMTRATNCNDMVEPPKPVGGTR